MVKVSSISVLFSASPFFLHGDPVLQTKKRQDLHDVVLEPGDFRRGDTGANAALNRERRARFEGVEVVVELDRLDERRDVS